MEAAQELAAKRAGENSPQLRSTESPSWQERAAWLLLCGVLVGVGLYILANYLRALAWALVLAIAIWPSYDRVRDPVCGEPVCEANSLLTGKLTGKFADSCLSVRFLRPVNQQIQGLAGKFPTQPNREFFEFEQGIESKDQGIFSVEEGIRIASLIQSAVRSAIRIVAVE